MIYNIFTILLKKKFSFKQLCAKGSNNVNYIDEADTNQKIRLSIILQNQCGIESKSDLYDFLLLIIQNTI